MDAVLARPALLALAVPLVITCEMAEGVIAGPAVCRAGFAVVMLIAHHMVRVAQLTLVSEMHITGPFLPDGQPAVRG